jgi:hypothetical protein
MHLRWLQLKVLLASKFCETLRRQLRLKLGNKRASFKKQRQEIDSVHLHFGNNTAAQAEAAAATSRAAALEERLRVVETRAAAAAAVSAGAFNWGR